MSEEILINITPMESRVAVVENGVLQEVHVERTQKRGIVGNIYKGKVVRVLPGMQAAFVDIGLERAAFIHAAEISNREGSAVESIGALVHEGLYLGQNLARAPVALLTTQVRNNTESAGVVAAHRDGNPPGKHRLALGRQG